MTSLPCNVVLLPEPELAERAIAASVQLAGQADVHFTLADGAFYPHISLYMLQLKTEDLIEVQSRLLALAADAQPLVLTTSRYWQAMQFLDAEYEKSKQVSEMQQAIIAPLNPLRDGMRAKDVERMQSASGFALENYQKYGWNTIGELYRPHLTLTRFIADQAIEQLDLPPIGILTGTFPTLGLFEMGDNSTCVRKIAEVKFSKDENV